MNVLVETSAFLAVLDRDDANHAAAGAVWENLNQGESGLVFHNYVMVETSAVILRRLGMEALRVFERDVVPVLEIVWVPREIHEAAAGAQMVAGRRDPSLVDCVSFEVMRRTGLNTAFAFDRHFEEFGYERIPV